MITWIIEPDIFNDNDARLVEAARSQGHEVIRWNDEWLMTHKFPKPSNSFIVFHGSLGNASQIRKLTTWKPGAFCSTEKFYCSAWYAECQTWLLHKKWTRTTVSEFVRDPDTIFSELAAADSVFVRPDSPLKPFSGRVLARNNISMKALDYGFYYDDENLPIVVTPLRVIDNEWRFVIVSQQVVAASAYIADGRDESQSVVPNTVWDYAQAIALRMSPPDDVYILDVCESGGSLHLLELNPFSGADLYACDRNAIVKAVLHLAHQAP